MKLLLSAALQKGIYNWQGRSSSADETLLIDFSKPAFHFRLYAHVDICAM
jgi:hypothetical protein